MNRGSVVAGAMWPGRRGAAAGALALAQRWVPLLSATFALAAAAAGSEVVINEIMFHPPDDRENLQFVELFNRGASPVDMSGWRLTKGIKFTFPKGTQLAASGYMVICRDRAAFTSHYGREIPLAGEFAGKLSHRGEELELSNARGETIDSVAYSDEDPWPHGADGYSASLERICPSASGREPRNWAASIQPELKRPAGTPGRRNDSYSAVLPPFILDVRFKTPTPGEKIPVTAEVADSEGVAGVSLFWRTLAGATESAEREVTMQRGAGDAKRGTYEAAIDGQPEGGLVRFRLKAVSTQGVARFQPFPTEPRPTYSVSTFINTNTARIPFAYVLNYARRGTNAAARPRGGQQGAELTRGQSAFVYVPPDGGTLLTFDYVQTRSRPDGFKVHFQKDRPFKGMTGINILFGAQPRQILSEPLSFDLFRMAGVPAALTDHLRLWVDGRPRGYRLLIEQPNKTFLTRNHRDDKGNLYKAGWLGQGIVGQHEKKTHVTEGSDDLVAVVQDLSRKEGAAQWEFIQQNFNVQNFVNYYAVSMCIENWDGFFNNYYVYHDTGGSGKWEIYPWDEDKTWGDYDGASPQYDWYEMPLTFGMRGDQPSGLGGMLGGFNGGPHGGASWWRHPGWFSGPLLANPEFRQRFLKRLDELCRTAFTEEKFSANIDALEERLRPEVALRAQAQRKDGAQELRVFQNHIKTFREQLKNRRKFILSHLGKPAASSMVQPGTASFPWAWVGAGLAAAGLVVAAAALGFRRRRSAVVPARSTAVPPLGPAVAAASSTTPAAPSAALRSATGAAAALMPEKKFRPMLGACARGPGEESPVMTLAGLADRQVPL